MTNKLHPFTKEDWYGLAGCETEFPEVGRSELVEVVRDGLTVSATVANGPNADQDEDFLIYAKTISEEGLARQVAETCLNSPNLIPLLLGEPVGEI